MNTPMEDNVQEEQPQVTDEITIKKHKKQNDKPKNTPTEDNVQEEQPQVTNEITIKKHKKKNNKPKDPK